MLETIGLTFGWSIVGRPADGKAKMIVDLPSRIRTAGQLRGYIVSRLMHTQQQHDRQETSDAQVMNGGLFRLDHLPTRDKIEKTKMRLPDDLLNDPRTPSYRGRAEQDRPVDPMIRSEAERAAVRAAEYDHAALLEDVAKFRAFAKTAGEVDYVSLLIRIVAGGEDAELARATLRGRWNDSQIRTIHERLGDRAKRAATRPEPAPATTMRAAGLPV
jgi:hypothetical protein